MTEPAEPLPAGEERFSSFPAMRSAHTHLLRSYRDKGASPELLDEADAFVARGSRTGVLIDIDDDRMGAQSLLDYWSAVLSRAERPPTQAFLEEFDESLAPILPDDLCPYVGLESFGESRRRLFFGRENVLGEMVEHLRQQPFLTVMGPLGSGKSSLVLGGLVPSLRSGVLPGSERWRYYAPLSPGADPLGSLALAVGAPIADDSGPLSAEGLIRFINDGGAEPAVLIIDRFEELFTLCPSPERREAFADVLLGLVSSAKKHIVLATLRSEFEAQIAALPLLHAAFGSAQFRLPPLSAIELHDAIVEPAQLVGLKFEPGLVERLVKEILGEPAGLPLLQFTLLKLWDLRDRNRLTLDAYRKIGGGRQALARTAEEVYAQLSPEEQSTLKTIVLLMVRPAAGMEVVTSSVRRSDAYAKADRATVDHVLGSLIAARLVRPVPTNVGEQRVELAHVALVWNWPRMVEWLDEERIATRRRVRLTTAAEQWRAHGKDPGGLLGGSLLDEARTHSDLSDFEKEFVDASSTYVAEAVREQERIHNRELEYANTLAAEQKRRADEQTLAAAALTKKNQDLRTMTGLMVLVLIAAIAGWITAERSRREAVRKQQTVEVLMAGQGVVVDESPSRPAATDPLTPPVETADPLPTAGTAPPVVAPALPSQAGGGAAARVGRPVPDTAVNPDRIMAQLHVRASREETGRRIAGTDLPSYRFAIWVEGPPEAMQEIVSVEYEFNHPTFKDKVQIGRERTDGFRVGYTGWGCLSIVTVKFKLRNAGDEPPHLDFDMCELIASAKSVKQ